MSLHKDKIVSTPRHAPAGAVLTVDLDAVVANYRRLRALAPGADVAGVVKANANGLGLVPVARALAAAGCATFFVADAGEGQTLRAALPEATIYVTNGLAPDMAAVFRSSGLRPCLTSLEEIEDWRREAKAAGETLPAALHFDTGLNRLGLSAGDADRLFSDPHLLDGIDLTLVMSHLARSDEPDAPLNALQLARFKPIRAAFPAVRASFANSSGILLGADYHFDMVRPGYGLYGGAPFAGQPNPFQPTVGATAPVLQVRDVAAGETAGYGGTWEAKGPRRLAVLSVGYADGYFRTLGSAAGGGRVWLGGGYAPVAGRVSMDLLIVDVTGLPEGSVRRGDMAELIGPHVSLDEVAARAGTIGYEVLTSLGERYKRLYTGKTAAAAES
ncbi:MAG TPA: alanine racemase [Parvibaculum sp.]